MKNYNLFLRNFLSFRISFDNLTYTAKKLFSRSMSLGNKDNVEYEVSFKSCGNLYEKWRKERKFRKLPKGDIDFKVRYVDTHKNISLCQETSVPTVVALHGAPGSCKDYSSLASFLQQNGVRVVAPSFPGKDFDNLLHNNFYIKSIDFSTFNPGVFRHSAEEKAQFVKDFLKKLSICQVDTLVVHSSAVYTGLLLCLENQPLIKSLVMLNPGTFSYDMKFYKHQILQGRLKGWKTWNSTPEEECQTDIKSDRGVFIMKLMVMTSEIPILYKLLQFLGPPVLQTLRVPVRADNYLDPLLSCTAMVRGNIPESKEKFLQLRKNGLPMLYAFSDDDKLIGKDCAYSLAHLLGCSDSDIYIYDTNGVLKQKGKETPVLKVISFENGSHYVFWKYADIINSEIRNFMSKL